jgi:O-antigen/teichoic acid export membrane protein
MSLIPNFIHNRIAHRPDLARIVDNIGWLLADKILRMGAGLFISIWLARYLGPDQFGQLNFAIAFVALFSAVATLGLNGIVVRDLVKQPENTDTTMGTAFLLQIIGAIISVGLIVGSMAWLRPDDEMTRLMVAILGSALLFKSSDVIKYWFESQVKSRYVVWTENISFLVIAALKAAMILFEAPLIAFVWMVFFEAALVALGLITVYGKKTGKLTHWSASLTRAKTLLLDSWPLIISSVSIVIYMKIDQVMLGEMIGNAEVGIYTAASRISEVWYFIPVAVNASVRPMLIKLHQQSDPLFEKRLQQIFSLMIWISVPIAIIMMFVADDGINMLYGGGFSKASDVLVVHIWAGVFVFLNNAVWNWYFATELHYLANYRILTGLMINVLLNWLLIPLYGAVGAAWATLISRAFTAYFGQLLNKKTRHLFFSMTKSIFVRW